MESERGRPDLPPGHGRCQVCRRGEYTGSSEKNCQDKKNILYMVPGQGERPPLAGDAEGVGECISLQVLAQNGLFCSLAESFRNDAARPVPVYEFL